MNLCDCYVTKVLGKPERGQFANVVWWTVKVEYRSCGRDAVMDLWQPSKEAAERVEKGFHFLA